MLKTLGWPELILLLVIVLLVFGVGRIEKIAGELGHGIKAFKDGLSGGERDEESPASENIEDTEE